MTINKKNMEKGFTLIEIMVVIIIIGILASIVAINVTDRVEDARRTKAVSQIETFRSALELYKLDNGSYPSTEQGLQALVSAPTTGRLARNWREGGYLERNTIPKDPWKHEYIYLSPGMDGRRFDITSYGDDGEPGGEGIDADINSWEIE
jgi:general secretion pathway protein G